MIEESKARLLYLLMKVSPDCDSTIAARKIFGSEVSTVWFADYSFDKQSFDISNAASIVFDVAKAYFDAFSRLASPEIINLEVQKISAIDIVKKQKVQDLIAFIIELDVSPDEVDYLKMQVRESYTRSALTQFSQKLLSSMGDSPTSALKQATRDIIHLSTSVSSNHTKGSDTLWLGDMIDSYRAKLLEGKPFIENMVPFPFPSWNRTLGGMRPGELVVLAASHNVGKSFLLHEIAWYASQMGFATVCAELEMLNGPLMQRLASSMSGVPSRKIEAMALTEVEMKLLEASMLRIRASEQSKKMLFVQNSRCATPTLLRAEIEQAFGDDSPRLVMIDYFDKMRPSKSKFNDSTAAQSDLCDELVDNIGKYFEVPVLTAVHLNRQDKVQYQFMDRKADIILVGDFDDAHPYVPPSNKDDDWIGRPGKLDWKVARNRNGVKGKEIVLSLAMEFATSSVTEWYGATSAAPIPSADRKESSTIFGSVDLEPSSDHIEFED